MTYLSKVLNLDNPMFSGYLTYSSLLVLKMMVMAPLTIKQRFNRGVMASPEDKKYYDGITLKKSHEDIDRVRRAHRNDLENILIFFLAGFGYMLTNPNPDVAINLFRLYTASRYIHTFVYAVCLIPQPARGLSWLIGYLITAYMAISTIYRFKKF